MLHYDIRPLNTGAHLLAIKIQVPTPESTDTKTFIARLPRWIPGSYKIRDYSRHLQSLQAYSESGSQHIQKVSSDAWEITNNGEAVTIEYHVYAYDLSVRGAYLDDQRLFFNHCCVCLDIDSHHASPRTIDIHSIDDWAIFTRLPHTGTFYYADNYSQQIDCPVESAAKSMQVGIDVNGIYHQLVLTGTLDDNYDLERLAQSLKKICAAQMQLFAGSPIDSPQGYLFMCYVEANQYGGLEHRNCTALMASPEMIIRKGATESDKTIDFLGLCSHEYFHLWNVKRLRPVSFIPYDLSCEQHSEMLWMFEGFTSYYDELMLKRAGIVSDKLFLSRQAKNLSRVLDTPGRQCQSLAESSFDAWTKLYQADENAANSMVSYYSKGAVFALYLDLFLREYSDNLGGLDEVMRELWENHGQTEIGIDESHVKQACAKLIPLQFHPLLDEIFAVGIHGYQDLDLATLITNFGITYSQHPKKTQDKNHTSDPGFRIKQTNGRTFISFLDAQSYAAEQGVSVNDEIFAINQQSVEVNQWLYLNKANSTITLTLNRRGRLFDKSIYLNTALKNRITLKQTSHNALSKKWLAQLKQS